MFIAGSVSAAGRGRYPKCGRPGATPRPPSGGYFAAATTARASAAELTPGAITPSAPAALWMVKLECSRSM